MENTSHKLFHSGNYRNRDGTWKAIQPGEIFIAGGINELYWKTPIKFRVGRDPIRTRSYVEKEVAVIDFIANQNQSWYELILIQQDN